MFPSGVPSKKKLPNQKMLLNKVVTYALGVTKMMLGSASNPWGPRPSLAGCPPAWSQACHRHFLVEYKIQYILSFQKMGTLFFPYLETKSQVRK